MRSWWLNPRTRDRFARTASALNVTALRSGAREAARVVLPAPGNPMIRILRTIVPPGSITLGRAPALVAAHFVDRLLANYTTAICTSDWLHKLTTRPFR